MEGKIRISGGLGRAISDPSKSLDFCEDERLPQPECPVCISGRLCRKESGGFYRVTFVLNKAATLGEIRQIYKEHSKLRSEKHRQDRKARNCNTARLHPARPERFREI